ncbi:MAG: hypothetical protein KR126chlam1_01319 [Chlamydiae bacterium]|nr:hypothetical protein [Chlamydiota bacterium]
MKSAEREKICINCEGRIPFDTTICPYCASEQAASQNNSFQTPLFQNQSLEDSLTSLYTPPYQGKRPQFSPTAEEESPEEQGYFDESDEPLYKDVTEKPAMDPLIGATVEEQEEPVSRSPLVPTLFLTAGLNLAILGLMQLCFSKNGILRLEWNASHWFFPVILAAPLLYFGYKKLQNFSD